MTWLFSTELTQYLLSQGVDLTVTTCTGDTVLHGGVHGNKPEVVDILIKAGMWRIYHEINSWYIMVKILLVFMYS